MVGCFVAIVVSKNAVWRYRKEFCEPRDHCPCGSVGILFCGDGGCKRISVTPSFADGNISHIAGATPLGAINATQVSGLGEIGNMALGSVEGVPNVFELLFGLRGGSLGETCIITLLIGGIYLIYKKVIGPIIPLTYIGTVFVMSWILGVNPISQYFGGRIGAGCVLYGNRLLHFSCNQKRQSDFCNRLRPADHCNPSVRTICGRRFLCDPADEHFNALD